MHTAQLQRETYDPLAVTYRDGLMLRGDAPDGPRIVVTGGRDYQLRPNVEKVLRALRPTRVAHGACSRRGPDRVSVLCGADRWADEIGRELGAVVQPYPARWEEDGFRSAGPIRNGRMLKAERPDLVIAFPGGTGTADCVRQARGLGIPVISIPEGRLDSIDVERVVRQAKAFGVSA